MKYGGLVRDYLSSLEIAEHLPELPQSGISVACCGSAKSFELEGHQQAKSITDRPWNYFPATPAQPSQPIRCLVQIRFMYLIDVLLQPINQWRDMQKTKRGTPKRGGILRNKE